MPQADRVDGGIVAVAHMDVLLHVQISWIHTAVYPPRGGVK